MRIDSMSETAKRQRIEHLKEQCEVEKLVSERIRGFIEKKRKVIQTDADSRDKLKDKVVKGLEELKDGIKTNNEEALVTIENIKGQCDEAEDERRERGSLDDDNAKQEKAKI